MRWSVVFVLMSGMYAQEFTRGVGVYPGLPSEDFAPRIVPDNSGTLRNLAFRRAALQSSAYDYNHTAHLVTDGIVTAAAPRTLSVTTSDRELRKNEREWLMDGNWVTAVELRGRLAWVKVAIGGGEIAVSRIDVDMTVSGPGRDNQDWAVAAFGSNDGAAWKKVGETSGMARPTGEVRASIAAPSAEAFRQYKLEFASGRPLTWQVSEVSFYHGGRVRLAGPFHFTSAWVPAGTGEEWVSVDLGAVSQIERVKLQWIRRAASGVIQVSDDWKSWKDAAHLAASDEVQITPAAKARYVRLLLTRPAGPEGYALSEFEVWGRGGVTLQPKPMTGTNLAGGAWKIQRASEVAASPESLSQAGFGDESWLAATVPGTALVSYLNAGAVADPNFSDQINTISDSYFSSDFWYRNEFSASSFQPGQRVWLDFDGINWKADVYLNGKRLGDIAGAFTRARFDVTGVVKPGAKNALAVLVRANANPGSIKEKTFENPDKNGGVLGADNPTYHASIGWDWIPTIRGRNMGIWNDVRMTVTGGVTVEDPLVSTSALDGTRATVQLSARLTNHTGAPVNGMFRGRFGYIAFDKPVVLAPGASVVEAGPITVSDAKLWWPAGYGEPNLYDVELRFEESGRTSDERRFKAGIRQWRYSEEGGALRMWINGRRFIPKGGNWGFSESMLRYRGREYDAAVRYHAHQNFNMIRNWVGMIGDDEFYEACDRHGVVVWQDFWLANPWDGPEPDDERMFLENAQDTVRRIRHHASVGLYCGRNEGYPPKPLNDGIKKILAAEHPGVHYIGSSADEVVSGHGPYRAQGIRQYFEQRATPKFHSEMGMPNITTYDSLAAMMKPEDMWPMGPVWGQHDFCLTGAQGGASFRDFIQKTYGGAKDAREFVSLAQFVNYDGYRAMYEAQSKNRMGLLIWMSHPTWPSFVWQTYDYYLEPTAAYFAARKAAEPLHIQWNAATDNVEVVNYSGGNRNGLSAKAEVLNLDGSSQWTKNATLDCAEDSVSTPFGLEFPSTVSAVHFVRLTLLEAGRPISENTYWRGAKQDDVTALRALPPPELKSDYKATRDGDTWQITVKVSNPAKHPALLVRVKPVGEKSGDRILPALWSDNFFILLPGESRTVRIELAHRDTRGERPRVEVSAFPY